MPTQIVIKGTNEVLEFPDSMTDVDIMSAMKTYQPAPTPPTPALPDTLPTTFDDPRLKPTLASTPDRQIIEHKVRVAAVQAGLDPDIAAAVAYQESGFNPLAVSPTGVKGTMQVTQRTAAQHGYNRDDPTQNILAGVAELKRGFERSPDNPVAALSAYPDPKDRHFWIPNVLNKAEEARRKRGGVGGGFGGGAPELKEIQLKDTGEVLQFPANMSDEEIAQAIKTSYTPSQRDEPTLRANDSPSTPFTTETASDVLKNLQPSKPNPLEILFPQVAGLKALGQVGESGQAGISALLSKIRGENTNTPTTTGTETPGARMLKAYTGHEDVSGNELAQKLFGVPFANDRGTEFINETLTNPLTYLPIPGGRLAKGAKGVEETVAPKVAGEIEQLLRKTQIPAIADNVPGVQTAIKEAGEIVPSELSQVAASNNPLQKPLTDLLTPEGQALETIRAALREAKPLRREQALLYSKERAQRFALGEAAGKEVSGEAGLYAQKAALKGEHTKVQFDPLRPKVTQETIDTLFDMVERNSNLLFTERVRAKDGLVKMLDGSVPTESEIRLLSEVFPKPFVDDVMAKRPVMQKVWGEMQGALNLPRTLMSAGDLSAPLRQGVFLIGRPKQFLPAGASMFKYAVSEKAYQGLLEGLKARPTYKVMREAKLALTDAGGPLMAREEAFMASIAEKIPLLKHPVKASNRAYSGFLTKLRADVFDDLYAKAQTLGATETNPNFARDLARYVNAATGRGDLGATLNQVAPTLNAVFFSPRLIASRVNLLNPRFYAKLDPMVRKEAMKDLFRFTGTGLTILGLAAAGGAKVGMDPVNADFGKIKVGNTRYDLWGGFQQYAVAATRLLTGEMTSSTSGKRYILGDPSSPRPITRPDILFKTVRSKLAPISSFVWDMFDGKTTTGDPFKLDDALVSRLTPMYMQDLNKIMEEHGDIQGLLMETPALFGVGVQTYNGKRKAQPRKR